MSTFDGAARSALGRTPCPKPRHHHQVASADEASASVTTADDIQSRQPLLLLLSSDDSVDGDDHELIGLPTESATAPKSWVTLPDHVLEAIAVATGPVWGAVLAQVHRSLAAAVARIKTSTEHCKAWSIPQEVINLNDVVCSVEMLSFARAQGCPWNADVCDAAARVGNLDVLVWAHENGAALVTTKSIVDDDGEVAEAGAGSSVSARAAEGADDGAAEPYDPNKGLHIESPWDSIAEEAARHGHVHILKWILEQGVSPKYFFFAEAAAGGHLHVVEFLHEEAVGRGAEPAWDEHTCGAAAHAGNLDVIKWAHARGCPLNDEIGQEAAYFGHVDILQWLHEQDDFVWTGNECAYATSMGQLEALKWLRAHGQPWGGTLYTAVAACDLDIVVWAHENGCPLSLGYKVQGADVLNASDPTLQAIQNDRPDIVAYLLRHDCFLSCVLGHLVTDLEVIQLMYEKGHPWCSCACPSAAGEGNLELFKWILGEGLPIPISSCIQEAQEGGHTELAEWLLTHYVSTAHI